ncbi:MULTISPECIES: CRISPR-associated endonuclease Cas2 [Thiorhodovibrio]|uniref:CRISPR-associated endonuclease Cas2 n=1 Tax=Thiorhodovibrio TaxID=61593 RepID=UPI001912FF73|nr:MULTISPECIES: CRISPR-associated endonuclease Cas2 [Thiorhodovibrio]MBK5969518.1 CRISPR-associated endonuclease Cas2 [Thiorhodovibrio winogradskyi]WPL14275.1 CRISPR-associated endoribonuclease Cas2 [Thiorhodovibrio litoralis]
MTHDLEHAEKRWYLVSYDIRDPKRWRRAYKTLQGHGERIQYSLFRCRLSRTEKEALRWELQQILSQEDDLMFVHLCPGCAAGVQEKGKDTGWSKAPTRYEVL